MGFVEDVQTRNENASVVVTAELKTTQTTGYETTTGKLIRLSSTSTNSTIRPRSEITRGMELLKAHGDEKTTRR